MEIYNKAVIKYPIAPKMRRYTTLWKTDVRKLACPEHFDSLGEKFNNSLIANFQQIVTLEEFWKSASIWWSYA